MNTTLRLLSLALLGALAACSRSPGPDAAQPRTAIAADAASGLIVNEWALPVPDGAAQPDLSVGPEGQLLVSWVRKQGDRNAFQYAAYLGDDSWESAPKTIAVGRTLTANWANTPHILMTDDRALWAHWLQTPADGKSPHASDIMLTRSPDNGVHWAPPVAVNDDATGTEHGFVSMWPAGQDAIGMAWLDGRKTAGAMHMHDATKHDAGAAGEMTVRGARFDGALQRSGEAEIDASTCDCCGTDAALTDTGPLLVYRDRSDQEIRDISATHLRVGKWDAPKPVHADGWKMTGCPLNGPSVGAWGPAVAVAWYTAPNDKPVLRLARSKDSGNTFDAPVDVDSGAALQGRVDVAKDGDATWLVWLREDGKGQTVQLARYANAGGAPRTTKLATLAGRGRGTGFPKIAVRNGVAFVVWTDIVEGRPRLVGAKVAPRG
ncbi:BNR repeat protein [Lysobacter dokdonensis DS-58]|uniref:BNR repeat protein n=1 Tax=Lysobacter dokdonensis DS-58 TaxID=1300345 RepID=A0A0A2WG62_9GAMM|nr:hypothetical protein [Lysobacter dokdonensis]KGQ19156.1 BNR repeat protein [Lysobacter dokdonensis DS-58]